MKTRLQLAYLLPMLLLVGAWLVSNHYPPWTAFYNESLAILALLALALISVFTRPSFSLPVSAVLVALLACVPLIQFGLGLIDFFGDAVITAGYLGVLSLSVVVGANMQRLEGGRFVDGLAWSCLFGAMASVVLALHQWLGLEQLGIWLMGIPQYGRPYANLGQPNNLATLLCLGLAGAIYLRERGQFGLVALALLALVLIAGVAMTRSRMSFLAITVMAGWIVLGRRRLAFHCSIMEVLIALAVFAVLWTGWPKLAGWLLLTPEWTVSRLQETFTGEVRLVLWQQLLEAIWRQPLSGYGWNQVSVAQMAVVADYPNLLAPFEYSHNLVIDLLVWNGAVLGTLIVLAMAAWLIARVWNMKDAESWFALICVLLILTHGMVELPHAYAYFLVPVGLCIGILSVRDPGFFNLSRRSYAVAVAVVAFFTAWIFVEYQTIEADHRLMRFESFGLEHRADDAVAPNVVLLTQLEEFIRFARTSAREDMSDEEVRWMGKVAHRYPYPPALMRYALALGLNHRPAEAALELRRLKQVQREERFEEVRAAWTVLVGHYPQLAKVALPAEAVLVKPE